MADGRHGVATVPFARVGAVVVGPPVVRCAGRIERDCDVAGGGLGANTPPPMRARGRRRMRQRHDGFPLTPAQWEVATPSCPTLDRRPIMSTESQIVPESARLTNLACAKCGSAEVRRLSLIYQEGLAIINTSSQTSGAAF